MNLKDLIKKAWFDWLLIIFAVVLLSAYFFEKSSLAKDLLIAVAIAGLIPVAISAIRALLTKKITVDLLASVALTVSFINGEWVSAAFINLMLASSRILGIYTESRATSSIKSLLKFRPDKVRIMRDGKTEMVSPEKIEIGDIAIVNPGERIPVDGVILKGQTSVDQSSLTGESLPKEVEVGFKVFSSTMNIAGLIEVKAEKVGKDTTLEKIIALVEKSQKGKAEIHTIGEKFSAIYIFGSIALAVIIYLISGRTELVLSVLLVVCADDIAVAVPLAFLASIGHAARRGAIIKGGNYLEQIAKTKIIFLDKTGTITKGELIVDEFFPEIPKEEFLSALSKIVYFSTHPISKAISDYLNKNGEKMPEMSELKEFAGRGMVLRLSGEEIFYGRKTFLSEQKVEIPETVSQKIIEQENEGHALVFLGSKKKFYGFITLSDEIRPEVKSSIIWLKKLGIKKIVMLTGDNEISARKVANAVGIEEFKANLMPEDKVKCLESSEYRGKGLVMVGDGVNDSASLALADVGIAMAKIGSDSAIEASNITLMNDNFEEIPRIIELAKKTMAVARQDFYIWGISNVIGLALVFLGFIGPAGAAAYNFLTDFLPLGNSLKLFRLTKET